MSRASDARQLLDGLSRLNRQQVLLRAAVLVLPAVAFGVEVGAGAAVQILVVALLTVSTGVSVLFPDSHAPLVVVLILSVYWAMEVGEQLSVSLLVVTGAILAFHVACLLAAYGPPSVVLDTSVVRLWILRGVGMLAAAVSVLLVAAVADGLEPGTSGWLLAAALLVLVGWAGILSRRLAVDAG